MLKTVGSSTIMYLFHFVYGRNHLNKSIEISSYSFCRAFTAHLLKEKRRFYHLSVQKYSQNTLCCKHFGTPGFMVFNILNITPSFLNEIQNVFFTKMISEKSSTKSDKMKSFLNTWGFLRLTADGSIR
jgi:hypothetical protein